MGRRRRTLSRGIRGHAPPPPGNFEIEVLGNAISSVLRDDCGLFNTLTNYRFFKQFY